MPGEIGNFLVTGHRTSAGSPMLDVPELKAGDVINVDRGKVRYVYRVADDMWINFRESASRARQLAAVPNQPGRAATRSAIVLSTCATPEDHANGDYWSDEFKNPTHRIAVYGFLTQVRAID